MAILKFSYVSSQKDAAICITVFLFVFLQCFRSKCKTKVHQDSEDLWNELVFYKEENKKLLSDK